MSKLDSVVIVGAGQAGAAAASALRAQGYTQRLTLIGREPHAPYERPPLSKAVLLGQAEYSDTAIHPHDFYRTQNIDLITHREVVALDRQTRTLQLDDGQRLSYDRCLLATGGLARELPGLPRGTPRGHYLRTLDDAIALRNALDSGVRLVIIGGGFLGLEIASSARTLGAEVTIIEHASRLLERALPAALSDWLATRVRAQGIVLHLGADIAQYQIGPPDRLTLNNGSIVYADQTVVAIGLTPEVHLAQAAGLPLDSNGGIQIDARSCSADPFIYAAGDCASQPRDALGCIARFESWQNANEQARTAAAAMLDLPPPAQAYPWFWTDQYGCNIQMLGLPEPGLTYTLRGELGNDPARQVWLGLANGIPRHGIAINAGADLRLLRHLFEHRIPLSCSAFSDTNQALKPLVKAWQAAAQA